MKRRGLRTRVLVVSVLFLGLFLGMLVMVPEVSAYTGSYDETFIDSASIDRTLTNVTGLGRGAITLPPRTIELRGQSEITDEDYYNEILVVGDIACVVSSGNVHIFNISEKLSPHLISSIAVPHARGSYIQIDFVGSIVYIPSNYGLEVLNVTDAQNPEFIASYGFTYGAYSVVVQDNVAFTQCSDSLELLNVTDPLDIKWISNCTTADPYAYFKGLDIVGNTAYVAGSQGFQILDISNVHAPVRVSETLYRTQTGYHGIRANANLLAVGCYNVIGLYDISNPLLPTSIANITARLRVHLYYQSDLLFSMGSGFFDVYNISDPSDPVLLLNQVSPVPGDDFMAFAVDGDYMHIAGSWYGVSTYQYRNTTEYWNYYQSYAEIQTNPVFTSNGDDLIVDATLQVDATIPANTSVVYYISARNGSYWDEAFPGVKFSFVARGQQLKWRAELSSSDKLVSPIIRSINVTCTAHITMIDLSSPASHASLNDSTPFFSWEPSEDTDQYLLQIDTTLDFSSGNLINRTVDASEYQLTEPLANGQWYWRVAGIDSQGQIGEFSSARAFTINTGASTGTGTNTTADQPGVLLLTIAGIAVVAVIVIVAVVRTRKR
jgi:hypothetical protein